MSSDERRIAPRKAFTIPIKFHAQPSGSALATARTASPASGGLASGARTMVSAVAAKPTRVLDMQEGITVNLSERGIYFKSAQKMCLGQSVELYLTLPRELTGRSPEPVRCKARVVHVEPISDERGWTGVGAEVERFEPLQRFRTWDN
jgi:PilZ domain